MAEAGRPRSHGRRAPAPGPWRNRWLVLRKCISRAFEAAARRWLWLVGAASLAGLALLGAWGEALMPESDATIPCARAAVRFDAAAEGHCSAVLRGLVGAARPTDPQTCAPEGPNTSRLCALDEPGRPRLFVWADNLLAFLYTLFFAGCISVAYARLRPQRPPVPRALLVVFVLSIGSALAGAIADHGENFWLLARIGDGLEGRADDLHKATLLSIWKFRLAALNLVLVLAWLGWALCRQHVPHAVLFPWPRWGRDAASRAWFDADTVHTDIGNVAQAYPLYPHHLVGLSGAPRGAALACRREGDRLRITVESAMLAEPYVVDVELDPARRGVRSVALGCPNLAPRLRDQGLAERMVLAVCRTAWQLGAVSLESAVPASPDEAVRTQNRRWVRMALRLGWDAELPQAAQQMLPPGLGHLASLQALLPYPDGRRWWPTADAALQLRFVCDPERAQPEGGRPDPARIAADRLCLARLQAFAAMNGIRFGL